MFVELKTIGAQCDNKNKMDTQHMEAQRGFHHVCMIKEIDPNWKDSPMIEIREESVCNEKWEQSPGVLSTGDRQLCCPTLG